MEVTLLTYFLRTVITTILLMLTIGSLLARNINPPDSIHPKLNLDNRLPVAFRNTQITDPVLQFIWSNPYEMFGKDGVVTWAKKPRNSPLVAVDLDVKRLKVTPGIVNLRDSKPKWTVGNTVQLNPNVDWKKVNLSGVAITIDSISRVSHGNYALIFRYSITQPNKVKLPLLFQPVFDGTAADTLCYAMYSHQSGAADDLPGYIPIVYTGVNTPLKCSTDTIGVRVYDKNLLELVTITVPLKYEFTKRYIDITRDNIRDYLALPGKAKMNMAASGNEADTLQTLSEQYLMEPALLLCKTSNGNFAKALLGLEAGKNNTYHLAITDARCYAKTQTVFDSTSFMAQGADSNIEYIQMFGNGGYLFNSNNFDFDMNGENAAAGEGDITINVTNGTSAIITHPLARIAY